MFRTETYPYNQIIMNPQDLFYLRLYVHNLSEKEIGAFLEIDTDEIYRIKESIESNFKTKSWENIIGLAFEKGILKKKDFIEDTVKTEALLYTENIFSHYIKASEDDDLSLFLKTSILEFYHSSELKLECINDVKYKALDFTAIEIAYIKLKFEKKSEEDIAEQLKKTTYKLDGLRRMIYKKLKVTNWFNAFRMAFYLNILDKSNYKLLNMDDEIESCAENIKRLKGLKRVHLKEKRFLIYSELLGLYTSIRYAYLLNFLYIRN